MPVAPTLLAAVTAGVAAGVWFPLSTIYVPWLVAGAGLVALVARAGPLAAAGRAAGGVAVVGGACLLGAGASERALHPPLRQLLEERLGGFAIEGTEAARLETPVTPESLAAALRASMSWARPFADRPGDVQILGSGLNGQVATMLRPIATPLNLGGFSPEVAEMLGASFRDYGFVPVAGAAAASQAAPPSSSPLRPGDAVGVNIVSGDFNMGATGTVTEVIGNRVYAFGHPFFNLGPIAFPMTRAYIHTLLPSMTSSMKIATTGDVIGTVHQDRATTIAGRDQIWSWTASASARAAASTIVRARDGSPS